MRTSHGRTGLVTAGSTLLVLVAVVLVGLVAPGPSYADDPPLPELTPVAGTPYGSNAPQVTTGRYLDHVRAEGDPNIYSFERTIPGSTILIGATVLREQGFTPRNRLVVNLAYPTDARDDGAIVTCGSNIADDDEERTETLPIVTSAIYSYTAKQCGTRGQMFLTIRVPSKSGLPSGTPYELDVWEVPPVTNGDTLPTTGGLAEPVAQTQPTRRVEPGPWLSEAARLKRDESVYVDLPLGRVSWFAVDVPFNRLLDAVATVSDPAGTSGGTAVEMRVVSPIGAIVSIPPLDDRPLKQSATIGSGPVTIEADTELVNPRLRLDGRRKTFYGVSLDSAQPGWYAIAVYAPNTTGDPDATLPMTLTPQLGRPSGLFAQGDEAVRYAGRLTPFPAPTGPEPTTYEPPASPSSDSGDGDTDASAAGAPHSEDGSGDGLAYGLTGGAAALVLVGVVALVPGRRRPGSGEQ